MIFALMLVPFFWIGVIWGVVIIVRRVVRRMRGIPPVDHRRGFDVLPPDEQPPDGQ